MTQLSQPLHTQGTVRHLVVRDVQDSEVEGLVLFHKPDPEAFQLKNLMY
jgi:hypothetical protein